MKKLLIFFLAASLFTACNSNNPFAKKDKGDKEDKSDRDKKDGDGYDDGNKETNYANSNWSKKQTAEWRARCMSEYRDELNAKQMCDCMIDKIAQKYPDERDAKEADEHDIDNLVEACEARFKNDNNDNGGYIKRTDRNDDFTEEGSNTTGWTDLQRQTFIQGCATSAQRASGYTIQQANSYCECMTKKVERKYTFEQAAKLTTADFQTQEWINAIAECRTGNN